jgi:3-hydroxybutyryl-CoA dehydrogenase
MAILVLGSGTMGSGIAQIAAQSGYQVYLSDPAADQLAKAKDTIRRQLARAVERGRYAGSVDAVLDRIVTASDWPDQVDWVIEAAPENVSLKQNLFRALDDRYPADVWLASNTSSIAITVLQAAAQRYPERVGGLHFFNPVPRMALVEIIRGLDTAPDFVEAARRLCQRLGKTAIEAPDRPGFLVNRVARPYYLEAMRLVDDDNVAAMEQVDQVMEGAGFRMGPFRVMDLVGVDVNFSVTRSVFEQTFGDERYRPHPWQERLVLRGFWGRKSGRGFYRYE